MLEFSLKRPPPATLLRGSNQGWRQSLPAVCSPCRRSGGRLHRIETYASLLVLQCWFVASGRRKAMRRPGLLFGVGLVAFAISIPGSLRAQTLTVNQLKTKIFDAKIVEKTFAKGARFCKELDGKHFYFETRDRILDLEEYSKSLDNLVRNQAFNPEKKRPWNPE